MKNCLTLLLVSFLSISLSAQLANPKVDKHVKRLKNQMSLAGDSASIVAVNSEIKTLGKDFPTDWRSYYWSVFFKIQESRFFIEDSLKKSCLKDAQSYFKKLDSFAETNPDVLCLKALYIHTYMALFAEESAEYKRLSVLEQEYLNKAYGEDPGNPHYYYLKAEFLYEKNPNPSNEVKTEILKYLDNATLQYKARKNKAAATPQFGWDRTQVLTNFLRSDISSSTGDFNIDPDEAY